MPPTVTAGELPPRCMGADAESAETEGLVVLPPAPRPVDPARREAPVAAVDDDALDVDEESEPDAPEAPVVAWPMAGVVASPAPTPSTTASAATRHTRLA